MRRFFSLVLALVPVFGQVCAAAPAESTHVVPAPRILSVQVDARSVHIQGTVVGATGQVSLIESRLCDWEPVAPDVASGLPVSADAAGNFTMTLDRLVARETGAWDRLLSRWSLAWTTDAAVRRVSAARYADAVEPRYDLPVATPRNRKGLGAFSPERPLSDVEELGISAVTVNIVLGRLIWTQAGEGRTPRTVAGRIWYVDERALEHLDRTLRAAADRQLLVSAIILVPQAGGFADPEVGRLMAHPAADPSGIYVMPNLASVDGTQAYAAAIDLLAERYARPDNEFGRIHHWILHNEIDSGWVWTNAGEQSLADYVELYHRSLRLTHLIARQYNPHAQVFISLDHYWTTRHNDHCYPGRDVLDELLRLSHEQGDFDWALAYHPYPQDLGNPRVWENDQVTFSFDTPKITFKNLEVLDAWVKRPESRYLGEKVRTVHLTEQGLNSRGYSARSLREQAAGMAYAWNKLKPLDSIQMFHYHNWVDNRGEGGLRIGLRKFPDDSRDPLGKKPIWDVYRALDTPEEDAVTLFAREIIGISDWSEVRYTGEIR